MRSPRALSAIIANGPVSPPMASIAIRGPQRRGRITTLRAREDFAAVIMAARRAQIVRQLQFPAIRAFLELGRRQRVVAAAHVALRGRSFSLGDSHSGTFSIFRDINKNCDDLRLI